MRRASTITGLPSIPRHVEDGDNAGSQPDHVTADSQSGSLCTGNDISRFESVESDKEGTLSASACVMRHASKNVENLDEPTILPHLARCHEWEC